MIELQEKHRRCKIAIKIDLFLVEAVSHLEGSESHLASGCSEFYLRGESHVRNTPLLLLVRCSHLCQITDTWVLNNFIFSGQLGFSETYILYLPKPDSSLRLFVAEKKVFENNYLNVRLRNKKRDGCQIKPNKTQMSL